MAKKVQKVTAKVGDATVTRSGSITFPEKYKKWESTCRSLGPGSIGGKVNLLTWLKRHGKPRRKGPNSNDGSSGMAVTMQNINRILESRQNGIYEEDDVFSFKDILEEMEEYNAEGSNLNPSNIPFTTYPVDSDGDRIPDSDPKTVFGHYLTPYFYGKYGSDGVPSQEAAAEFFSANKNEANPPIKQAMFGGSLFPAGTDLYSIIQLAIKEIEDLQYDLEIRSGRSPVGLVNVPSFRKKLGQAINSSLVDGKISISGVKGKLEGIRFPIATEKEQQFVAEYSKTKNIAGDFKAFKLVSMTPANTKRLIETYMATGKGKERDIVKSWVDLVRV